MKEAVAGLSGGEQDGADREGEEATEEKADSGEIRLQSKVVRATGDGEGIVVVRMEDRQGREHVYRRAGEGIEGSLGPDRGEAGKQGGGADGV